MGDLVNLRSARKRRERADAEVKADANRTRHGLPKAFRTIAETEARRASARIEGHRLRTDDTDET